MALAKAALKAAILELFNSESEQQVNPAEARERQAEKLANAIDVFVKSGTVNVTGTSVSGGAVTASGKVS